MVATDSEAASLFSLYNGLLQKEFELSDMLDDPVSKELGFVPSSSSAICSLYVRACQHYERMAPQEKTAFLHEYKRLEASMTDYLKNADCHQTVN